MDIKKILLPYNFTELDNKALDFVIKTFSGIQEAKVTIFNIFTPAPSIDVKKSPGMKKMQESVSYLNQLISEQEESLKKVKQILVSGGFAESHVKAVFMPKKKEISNHIIEMATAEKADLIVLSRKSGIISRFFTKSVFNRAVMELKDKVVCIVS
jgi:nucleotide-binding universal stress UspA family protein